MATTINIEPTAIIIILINSDLEEARVKSVNKSEMYTANSIPDHFISVKSQPYSVGCKVPYDQLNLARAI
jgi:hypothetical protein